MYYHHSHSHSNCLGEFLVGIITVSGWFSFFSMSGRGQARTKVLKTWHLCWLRAISSRNIAELLTATFDGGQIRLKLYLSPTSFKLWVFERGSVNKKELRFAHSGFFFPLIPILSISQFCMSVLCRWWHQRFWLAANVAQSALLYWPWACLYVVRTDMLCRENSSITLLPPPACRS